MSNMGRNIAMFIALVIVMFLLLSLNPLFIIVAILVGLIYRGVLSHKIIKPLIIVALLVIGFNFVRGINFDKVTLPKRVEKSPQIQLNDMQTYTYNDTLTEEKIIEDYIVKITDDKDTLTKEDVKIDNYDTLLNDFNNPEYTGTETVKFSVTDTDGNTTVKEAKLKIEATSSAATDQTSETSSDAGSGIISNTKSKLADKAIASTIKSQIDNKGYGTSNLDATTGVIDISLSSVDSSLGKVALSDSEKSAKAESLATQVCGKVSSYKTIQIRGNDGGVIYTKSC